MDDGLFDRLNTSRKDQQHEERPELKQQQRIFDYFNDVFERNNTRSVQVGSVVVNGGGKSSHEFLKHQLDPVLSKRTHTLGSLVSAIDQAYTDLASFGVYDQIHINVDEQPSVFHTSDILNIRPTIQLKHANRFTAKTGTDVGNGEGNGYMNFALKDIFGGAEMLSFDATMGTRTRSSYLLNYSQPLQYSARWKGELLGYINSRSIPYASHDQVLRGVTARVRNNRTKQEFGLENVWRTLAVNQDYAGEAVRAQAGDNAKSAVYHSWVIDKRDSELMPTSGYMFKTMQEIAGFAGELPYIKGTFESQLAAASPTKFFAASLGCRGGLLWTRDNEPSHLMDRFYLGGANDVRGFNLGTLGPKGEGDSVGGDAYFAAGLSLYSKLPKLSAENPLRAHGFVNAGSVLPLDQQNVGETVASLVKRPSVSMGVGLLYNHPIARFELNFTLPLAARPQDGLRKGLQFGVGFSFL